MAGPVTIHKIPNLLVVLFCLAECVQSQANEIFENTVRPFLNDYCISCHGPDKAKAKIRLDTITPAMTEEKDSSLWARILEALAFGEMPSAEAKKFPTRQEARVIETWISTRLANQGIKVEEKQSEQGFGLSLIHI